MRYVRGYLASRKQRAWLLLVFPKYICWPIFQTVSWAQRNEAINSSLKVHWRHSISSNFSLLLLKTDSFAVFLRAIVSRTRAKGLPRLSVDDNTAAKMFVCPGFVFLRFRTLNLLLWRHFVFPKCSA